MGSVCSIVALIRLVSSRPLFPRMPLCSLVTVPSVLLCLSLLLALKVWDDDDDEGRAPSEPPRSHDLVLHVRRWSEVSVVHCG